MAVAKNPAAVTHTDRREEIARCLYNESLVFGPKFPQIMQTLRNLSNSIREW
jgi:hypothetical protein